MSRTDKDMPPWVIADLFEPEHWGCRIDGGKFECDLPEDPTRQHPTRLRYGYWDRCHWKYVWPWTYGHRSYRLISVPKWFIDNVWNEPERRRERDDLRALRDEYNANGNLEDGDFPCWQTRGFARWMWD